MKRFATAWLRLLRWIVGHLYFRWRPTRKGRTRESQRDLESRKPLP